MNAPVTFQGRSGISTQGFNSYGVFAQSVGRAGGGSTAGPGRDTAAGPPGQHLQERPGRDDQSSASNATAVALGLGGTNGAGGAGGQVSVS